jgi:hypothetical protein
VVVGQGVFDLLEPAERPAQLVGPRAIDRSRLKLGNAFTPKRASS